MLSPTLLMIPLELSLLVTGTIACTGACAQLYTEVGDCVLCSVNEHNLGFSQAFSFLL